MHSRLFSVGKRLLVVLGLAALVGAALAGGQRLLVSYRIETARTALLTRDADRALQYLQAAQRLDDRHAELHFLLARSYRRLGRLNEVREHLRQARQLGYAVEPLRREWWLALAQTGRLRDVERHLPNLLKDPRGDEREICEAFIAGYFLNYRSNEAFQLLDAWQKDYPDDPYPHYIRGRYWEQNHNPRTAVECYREALERNPRQTETRARLARLLVALHRHDEAVEHYRYCLKHDPHNPDLLAGWAQCLIVLGEHRQARKILADLLVSEPNHFEARAAMGQLELSAGRPAEALQWLEPAADQIPYDTTVRHALAQALQRTGKAEAAREHFTFVSEAERASARVQELVEQLRREPHNVELRYQIGVILMRYDDPVDAATWLRGVLEIEPDHLLAHVALAKYYEECGLRDLAHRHRDRAEELRN